MTTFKLYDHTGEQLAGSCTKVAYSPPGSAASSNGKVGETTIEERLFIQPRLVLQVEAIPHSKDLRLENAKGETEKVSVVGQDEAAKTITVEGMLSSQFVERAGK